MSFASDFKSCLSPLPAPDDFLDSADDFLEWLEKLHSAWESSGGDEEMLMAALVAAGAVTGIDEAGLAVLAGATVSAYITACIGCLASAAGSQIWDLISSADDSFIKDQLVVAANDRGIPKPGDSQMA
jgi:hypothetical protein